MARKQVAWWLHTKLVGVGAPSFQDSGRWKKRGNVYTLSKPDMKQDRWVTHASFKSLNKLEPGEKLYIAGTANANIIDRVQERLDPRGLDCTDYLRNAMLLAHHNYYCPVGQVDTLDIQDHGVDFKAWIGNPQRVGGPEGLTDMQHEMRSLVAQDVLKAVSVGFIPHKFRAPLYNDQGDMEEPLVIESWELLELSIVAVPCNQLSLFQMREAPHQPEKRFFPVAFNANGGDALKFLGENFTNEELTHLIAQATEQDDSVEDSDDNDDSQEETENVALKPKTSASGGKSSSNTGKDGGSKGESSDDEDEEEEYEEGKAQKEMLTLIRQMNVGQGKTLELLGDMMKHLLKKDAASDDSEEEEEEEKSAEIEALEERVAGLEEGQKEIVEAIKGLTAAVKGKKAA